MLCFHVEAAAVRVSSDGLGPLAGGCRLVMRVRLGCGRDNLAGLLSWIGGTFDGESSLDVTDVAGAGSGSNDV